jgi:hypothetical protein
MRRATNTSLRFTLTLSEGKGTAYFALYYFVANQLMS